MVMHTARVAPEEANFSARSAAMFYAESFGETMKLTYSEQLKHPNWQKLRLKMLSGANFRCVECGDDETTLHVHHKQYIKGRMAWEYEDSNFEVLCEVCHEQAHLSKDELNYLIAQLPSSSIPAVNDLLIGWTNALSKETQPNDPTTSMIGALAFFMDNALNVGEIELLWNSLVSRMPFDSDLTITLPKRDRKDLDL